VISRYNAFADAFVQAATDFILKMRSRVPTQGKHHTTDDEAFACWAYYLSMLAVEALWGIQHLVRQNAVRVAFGLTRSSFEYLIRLEYYAAHKEKARVAFASIGERILFHGNNYGNLSPELVEELRHHQKRWRNSEPTSSFKELLRMTDASNAVLDSIAKRIMTEFYEVPSGFVHGAGATMMDVLLAERMADTVYDPNKTIGDACVHLFCMLHVLRTQFVDIYGDAVELDAWFTQFAELANQNLYLKDKLEAS
jgi:hypothetical protein